MPTETLGPRETSATPAQDRQSHFGRFLRSAIRFAVVLTIAAVIGAAWYLATKGFGTKTRALIIEELHKHGIEAHIAHLTLDPFRGLIAQDVRLYDYKKRENMLAVVSEISLDINYGALLHRQPFLNGLDVRNAQIRLPGQNESEKPQLQHFNAHVYFPPDQIYVSEAEGLFCGVRISITGHLIKRADYKPSPPLTEEEWQRRLSILQRVTGELRKFSYPGEHPRAQIKFSGDLAEMENARAEFTLRGERIRRDPYELKDLLVAAEFADQRLTITQLQWHDGAGDFSAHGDWSRQSGEANFQAHSTLDLKTLLNSLGQGEFLRDANFSGPPKIDISARAKFAEAARPQIEIMGHAALAALNYHSLPLTDIVADFSWDGERIFVRDLHARQDRGELRAEMLDAPNDFRLKLESTINPIVARNFLSPEMREFLGQWEFSQLPAIHLEIHAPSDKPESWIGDGALSLGKTRFRGAWMNSARSTIHFGDGAVTYSDLRVERDDGNATGSFTYDFKNHEVRIVNMRTSINPTETIVWVDPDLVKTVVPYKFHAPPNLVVNGLYQFGGGKATKIDINVDGARGMDYVFCGKPLPFDRVNAKLTFTSDRLQIVDLRGGIFLGNVRGSADISLGHKDQHYSAKVAIEHIDFPSLTDLYWQYKTAHGQLSGSYDFTGVGADARAMRGTGKVDVANGDVFAIPVFGPLSGIMSSILPGTGYSIGKKATASFKIDNGIIHTDNLEVAGNWFSMLGHGDLHFLDDKLDFDVRMDMHGAAGLLMKPVYKFFEYVGEGSLKNPDWHPKRF